MPAVKAALESFDLLSAFDKLVEGASRDELRAIQERIAYLLAVERASFDDFEGALWLALARAVPGRRAATLAGLEQFVYSLHAEPDMNEGYGIIPYRAACQTVLHFLKAHTNGPLRPAVRNRLLDAALQCVKITLCERNMPVTRKTVLKEAATKLEWNIDQQFPGYAAAGLLTHLARVEVA